VDFRAKRVGRKVLRGARELREALAAIIYGALGAARKPPPQAIKTLERHTAASLLSDEGPLVPSAPRTIASQPKQGRNEAPARPLQYFRVEVCAGDLNFGSEPHRPILDL
jgi:hypothetical protein